MTAEASKKALEKAEVSIRGGVSIPKASSIISSTNIPGVVLTKDIVPAAPLEPLSDAIVKINVDNPFTFLVNHYKVDGKDWIKVASSRQANKSNQAVKKLIAYINAQSGIDAVEALSATDDGQELKLTRSAAVSLRDLLSEVQARQNLWDYHPYLQVIMERTGGSTEDKQNKRLDLIDAMVVFNSDSPEGRLLFGLSYDILYQQAGLRYIPMFRSQNALYICKNPDVLDKPDPKEIALDILQGKVSELTSSAKTLKLPEPQWPSGTNKDVEFQRMLEKVARRINALQTSMYCSVSGETSKTCVDWINDKIKVFTDNPTNLEEYLDYASQNLPEFISLFKS
jgi:hypothetical protein